MTNPIALTSEQLKNRADLVAVDGRLYDLASFAKVHPGGAVIEAAGAYDASALYHSMHLGQNPLKSELFQKYYVGTHKRDSSDTTPVYVYDSAFALDLQKSIRKTMGATSWYAPWGFWLRTLAICSLTIYFEYQWATTGTLLMGVLVGILHAQIGLSVQHDASHGALSRSPTINAIFSHGADWIGNSRFLWLQQHVLWHHPFTNHHDLDPDASSAEPLLVFSDYSQGLSKSNAKKPTRPLLSAQNFITHLVLAAYGPSIVFNLPAILQMNHNEHIPASIPRGDFMSRQKVPAVLFRTWYLLRIVVAPWLLAGTPPYMAMFLVSLVTGTCLTFLFVVSHNFEGSDRDPLRLSPAAPAAAPAAAAAATKRAKSAGTTTDICWYKAQVETSCTYGGTEAMLLTGGLNLQIEHHLFPRLSSWYYPRIQRDVQQCCERHGVVYKYYPSLWDNTRSMLRYMRKVGVAAVLAHAE